jgi:hypothetical protein
VVFVAPISTPTAVQAETDAMPAQQRLGLEDDRNSDERREQPVEPDKDWPICSAQPELGRDSMATLQRIHTAVPKHYLSGGLGRAGRSYRDVLVRCPPLQEITKA